jgi:uncharacterized protein with ParB-like and HNH nuclease domain
MLQLTDIVRKLPFEIKSGSSSYSIKEFATNKYGIVLDFDVFLKSKDKKLQRDLCWDINQKRSLIVSVFKRVHIPSISVVMSSDYIPGGDKLYKVIDGKQRLTTCISFFNNEFGIIHNGNEYFYKDLSPEMQSLFHRTDFTQNIAYEYPDRIISDDSLIDWFDMINFAGTAQDEQHLKNLRS